MSGAGIQGAGGTSAGYGSPAAAAAATGTMLADRYGRMTGARAIDPVTRDYVLNADGRLSGMSATGQVVHLAVHTDKFSSAAKELGNELRSIDRVTTNVEARIFAKLSEALQPAVDAKLVQVLGFTTFRAGPRDGLREGRLYGRLRWLDVTTGQEAEEIV